MNKVRLIKMIIIFLQWTQKLHIFGYFRSSFDPNVICVVHFSREKKLQWWLEIATGQQFSVKWTHIALKSAPKDTCLAILRRLRNAAVYLSPFSCLCGQKKVGSDKMRLLIATEMRLWPNQHEIWYQKTYHVQHGLGGL